MIISPSHTLEYKPNDIIITSSIGYVLLHNPNIIETILASFPGSTSKGLGSGASVLYLALLRLLTVLSVALSYVASSLVSTPKNQRKLDSTSLRSFAEQRYLARCVAPRDLSLLPCCYSFLIQGKNTCENILQSVLQLGLLQKGTHISLVYCVHRPTDCILPEP